MDSWNYKYEPGQYVFTEHGAKNNLPPLKILEKSRHGWNIVREDPTNPLSKKVIDPETGKAMRTPYEPGYRVRREISPEDWSEFVIPESAIKGDVSLARGGLLHMDKGGKAGKLASGLATVGKRLLADAPVETRAEKQMRLNMMPTARIGLEAPGILIPSKMNNVREAVRNMKGNYGARRVERAADEIPNLERMYQEDALKEAFTGDNARAVMTMNPKDFEKYASTIPNYMESPQAHRGYGSQFLDESMKNMTLSEYIDNLAKVKGGFADVPYLIMDKQEQGLPLIPFITGHEGRHRSRALANMGEEGSLVQLLPRSELRETLPRRTQEEYIEALKEELEMTKNKVKPQVYFDNLRQEDVKRPAVDLPDIYAEGGGAFKKLQWFDGGGMAVDLSEPSAGSRREPLLTEKDWANIKRNAPAVYDWAKQNVKDEASQLKTARGVKDFALRTGAQYAGGIPDLVNLGLMGVDALADTNLSSEKPWFGSEQYIDLLHKSGALGENEFPIAETVAGVLAPAGLIKKGIKKVRGLRPVREEPKKRRGGLTAMSR
jgi:hypothetical protein